MRYTGYNSVCDKLVGPIELSEEQTNYLIHQMVRRDNKMQMRSIINSFYADVEELKNVKDGWIVLEYDDSDLHKYIHHADTVHKDSVPYHWLQKMIGLVFSEFPFKQQTYSFRKEPFDEQLNDVRNLVVYRIAHLDFEVVPLKPKRLVTDTSNAVVASMISNNDHKPGMLIELSVVYYDAFKAVYSGVAAYNEMKTKEDPSFRKLQAFMVYNHDDPLHVSFHTEYIK